MLKNYLKTALRNLWGQKTNAIINVSGLTLGIASSLVLFLMIRYMSSFDDYHAKRDRIYRIVTESSGNNKKDYTSGVPPVLHDAFRTDFNEAEEVTFISYQDGGLVSIPVAGGESKKFEEDKGIAYVQPNFFRIFDRKIISGDATNGLDEPNEAILSKKSALKYFGTTEAIGDVLKFDNREFKVTAIMEDFPPNTDFPFDVMLSFITIKKEKDEAGWHNIWSNENCYFLLNQEIKLSAIEQRMPSFTKKYMGEGAREMQFRIQPFHEAHFDNRFGVYGNETVSTGMLSVLSLIALFLIVTACINFINLSTAEAIKRSREVGIRKSLGSTRQQLILQFLGESGLVTVFSMLLALVIAWAALSFLNPFLGIFLRLNFTSDGGLWIFIIGVTVLVTFLSGLYPSLVVSGFNPILALKNKTGNRNSSGFNLRRGLVVLQFVISQGLIIGTIVLISQMNYFKSKDLGFRKDAIVVVPLPEGRNPSDDVAANRMHVLREEVSKINGVTLSSLSSTPPSSGNVSGSNFSMEGNTKNFETQMKMVDGNYINLYELKIVAGESLPDLDTARGFVVNERLSALVGYKNPRDIIGLRMNLWGKTFPVIGVVKDFHTMSLHDAIEATVLFNRIKNYRTISVAINPLNIQQAISAIQIKWEAAYPEHVFSYKFMDEQIGKFYENEEKISILMSIFTTLAIFIGCLGLFGLASFMANQKIKEIGVRKVLGASVESIVLMFTKEYLRLIVVAFFLAGPLAWYVMNRWLNEFAYKIALGPVVFISGIGLTFLLAFLTVGFRSVQAASVNPAQSLRSE